MMSKELVVHEDPITGIWTFHLDGHAVEVEPRHGFIKIDGRLHRSSAVTGLHEVEDLRGTPLATIKRLVALQDAQHDDTRTIPAGPRDPRTQGRPANHDAPTPSTPKKPRSRAPRTTTKPSKRTAALPPDPAFNTGAAAKYLGLSPKTLETQRSRGDGPPFVKLGRRVVYRQADLDAWLAERVRSSTSAE